MKLSSLASRCAGLPLLVLAGLMATTAIDADGDVTTTNLPTIVLVSTRDLQTVADAEIDNPDSDVPTGAKEIRCAGPSTPQARCVSRYHRSVAPLSAINTRSLVLYSAFTERLSLTIR